MDLLGNAGKPGSLISLRPFPKFDPQEEAEPIRTGSALPHSCLYVLHDPFGKAECYQLCEGRQRDGSCLVDQVKALGFIPECEIDHEGFWVSTGHEA